MVFKPNFFLDNGLKGPWVLLEDCILQTKWLNKLLKISSFTIDCPLRKSCNLLCKALQKVFEENFNLFL